MTGEECVGFPFWENLPRILKQKRLRVRSNYQTRRGNGWCYFLIPPISPRFVQTEFMAFAAIHDELAALNVKLIGLSVDSVSAHLAWVHNIKEKMGVVIPFPVIADLNMKVAKKYGMIPPGPELDYSSQVRVLHR